MAAIRNLLRRFAANESGATSIEYALIAASIAVVIVTVISELGGEVKNDYQSVSDALK
ncbi:MAG: Flp family type IVb pilin [Flavobacteriaceae bacterium]